jgi:hypothetical protein
MLVNIFITKRYTQEWKYTAMKSIYTQASIPESYELYGAEAGILTYSPLPGLPTLNKGSDC